MKKETFERDLVETGYSSEAIGLYFDISQNLGEKETILNFSLDIQICGDDVKSVWNNVSQNIAITYTKADGNRFVSVCVTVDPDKKTVRDLGRWYADDVKPEIKFENAEDAARIIRNIWHIECLSNSREAV